MANTYQSPKRAPDYVLHRDIAAVDTSDSDSKNDGMNMHGFRFANIQIIPTAGQNPTAEVMFWSEEAGQFIKANTALVFAGIGASKPYELTVDANGRIIWVKLTVGYGKVFISGWEAEYR